MRLQTKLSLIFCLVAAITFGVSFLGYWQVAKFGAALYEIGAVRLPSIEGLNMIQEARTTLGDSASVLLFPDLDDARFAAELEKQKQAWALFEKGWNLYDPLPQTPAEEHDWSAFVSTANAWRANYETMVSLMVASRKTGDETLLAKAAKNLTTVSNQYSQLGDLLTSLTAINYQVANATKKQTVDSHQAMLEAQIVMLFALILSVIGAVACGAFIRRSICNPIVEMAQAFFKVSKSDFSTSVPVRSQDEIGRMSQAFNEMVEKLRWRTTFLDAQVNASLDGILVVDSAGKKLLQNKLMGDLWKIPPQIVDRLDDEAQLQYVMGQVKNPESFLAKVKHLYSNPQEISRDEIELKDGRVFDRYSSPVLDQNQFNYGRIWIFRDVTDRKQAEEMQKRLVAIVNSSEDAIIGLTLEGIITSWNFGAEKIFGHTAGEAIGQPHVMLFPVDRLVEEMEILAKMGRGEFLNNFETVRLRKDGKKIDISVTLSPIADSNGKIIGVSKIARNVTDRKQTEEELRKNLLLLEHSQNLAHLGFYTIDLPSRTIILSEEMARMFRAGNSAFSLSLVEYRKRFFPPEEMEKRVEIAEAAYAAGTPLRIESRVTRADGQIIWVQSESKMMNNGTSVLGVVQDVTEQKLAEAALRLSEAQLRATFEGAALGIALVNVEGRPVKCNPALARMLGYSESELSRLTFPEFTHPDDVALDLQLYRSLMAGERDHYEIEKRYIRKDGRVVWGRLKVSLVKQPDKSEPLAIGMVEDITERRKLEEQFRQAQKMEAFGQLAGGVAHDFNNILAVILMQAELMQMGKNISMETKELAEEIGAAAQRAATLTRQLLLFSRKETMHQRDLDLNLSIHNMSKMLQRTLREDIQMQFKFAREPLFIHADAGMMDQVLMNLAVNARDAMTNGGKLVIETTALEIDGMLASLSSQARSGSFVCLSVSDTGCGISAENISRIFEPFYTTKEVGKGTGLGLATVFGIVQQHEGWIDVYSEVGIGTIFRIYLPRLAKTSGPNAEPAAPKIAGGGTETILLVEDDAFLRSSVRKTLLQLGYRVLEAVNGIEALEISKQHHAEIRLLLTDMVMPGGMTGIDLAEKVLQENPTVKVIYASGYIAEVVPKNLHLEEGVNFLTKPFQAAKLAHAVRARLDAPAVETKTP